MDPGPAAWPHSVRDCSHTIEQGQGGQQGEGGEGGEGRKSGRGGEHIGGTTYHGPAEDVAMRGARIFRRRLSRHDQDRRVRKGRWRGLGRKGSGSEARQSMFSDQ
jgi:hypothetical protein